jgi:hypothetical protein
MAQSFLPALCGRLGVLARIKIIGYKMPFFNLQPT